jgi:pyruvate/2-oxoglutarate dehydrogenase complex dihydrolipoamide dehydrogenase (E3) component
MAEEQTVFDYDLLVIGGGSGGIASAKRAASLYKVKVGGKYLPRSILPNIQYC